MKLRRVWAVLVGIATVSCGADHDGAGDPSDAGLMSDGAASDRDGGLGGARAALRARVVSSPPAFAVMGERYRYRPKSNTKARTLELVSAPAGMSLNEGALDWSPNSSQQGRQRVVLRMADAQESTEQSFQIHVATSTLRAEADAARSLGGRVFAAGPLSGLNGVGVAVSPGSVRSNIRLSVSQLDVAPAMPNSQGRSTAVRFGPLGAVFDAPARVTLPLPKEVVSNSKRLGVYVYEPASRWKRVPLVAVDTENGLVTAKAAHFSIYAALQSSLDLETTLTRAPSTSACAGALMGSALLTSPLSEVALDSVNNLPESLRALVASEDGTVRELLSSAGFTGSLRVVHVLELSESLGDGELALEQRLLVHTLYFPGDGTATLSHTDALGNLLALKRYAQPLRELDDMQQRLRGAATNVRFETAPVAGLGLAARVHLLHFAGDASLDPVSSDDLGLAAVDSAPSLELPSGPSDGDCDGLVDAFDGSDDRLTASIQASPSGVSRALTGESITLRARVQGGADASPGTWAILDATNASLTPMNEDPAARRFSATEPGRYLVSFRVGSGVSALERIFAIDVLARPLVNTPPTCQPSKSLDTGRVGEPTALHAITSDQESEPNALQVEWGLIDGERGLVPSAAFAARGVSALYTPTSAGNHAIGCRAFDGDSYGPVGSVDLGVVDANQNRAPTDLTITPATFALNVGGELALHAFASDPDGDALNFVWSVAGARVDQSSESSDNLSRLQIVARESGTVDVDLSVSDGKAAPLHVSASVLVGAGPIGMVDADADGWPAGQGGLGDCDDSDPAVHPMAPELCRDGKDNDCNGKLDDATTCAGTADAGVMADGGTNPLDAGISGSVDAGKGGVSDGCVQSAEICDGLDNDCNGIVDDQFACTCNPNLAEICTDYIDNNCNDLIDGNDPQCFAQSVQGESCHFPQPIAIGTYYDDTFAGARADLFSLCADQPVDRVYSFEVTAATDFVVRLSGPAVQAWSLQRGTCNFTTGQYPREFTCGLQATPVRLDPGTWFLVAKGAAGPFQFAVEPYTGSDAGTATATF